MRTTINLDNDALALARGFAKAHELNLGQAVSELIRRGRAENLPLTQKDGIWVFDLSPDAPRVIAQQVRQLLDESA